MTNCFVNKHYNLKLHMHCKSTLRKIEFILKTFLVLFQALAGTLTVEKPFLILSHSM